MINIQNETRGAVPRYFALLGFVFLLLALSFGSLASNAAPQVLKRNAGKTPCRITSINAKTGVVTASIIDGGTTTVKASSGGQSFRFLVKDAALLSSLKEGQEIFADFNAQEVFTSASGQVLRLGGILTDSFGKSSAGPAGGTNPVGPVDAGRPIGPVDGGRPIGPVDAAKLGNAANPVEPCCSITSINAATGVVTAQEKATGRSFQFQVSNSALLKSLKAGQPVWANFSTQKVSVDGAQPCCSIVSLGKVGGVGNTAAGQNLGNAANPGDACCNITSINPATGVVRAKNLSTGQAFQFTVKNSALLHSLNVGQRFFANFNSHQVSFDGKAFTGVQSFSFSNPGAQD